MIRLIEGEVALTSLSRIYRAFALLPAVFLLSGCDSWPKAWSRNDIEEIARNSAEDIADDVISSRASDMESRIQQLESEVAQLKSENAEIRSYIAARQ